MLVALLAGLAVAWTPPQARGPWAHRLRERACEFYAGLETDAMRLRVDSAKVLDSLRGPAGAVSWRIAREGGARPEGTDLLRLEWTDSVGSTMRVDRLPVRIVREELVPVAVGRLYAGSDLDTTSLRWEWRRTNGSVQAPAPRTGIQGRRLSRGVGPGQVLLSGALEPPTMFRRQEHVRILLEREGTRIKSEGIAQEDGRLGKSVRVRGPFGSEIRGRVQADSTVLVD